MPGKKSERRSIKWPSLFGAIPEKNVTFLVDISGSMYEALDDVKDHLIKAITEKCCNDYDGMINIIAFSDVVHSWASSVMPCTERTVSIATEWIRNLESKGSTNTQEALITALQDPETDAIYLVTDGLPDDQPAIIFQNVNHLIKRRPIHCYYMSRHENDNLALEFLKHLAYMSDGSTHLIKLDETENIRDVDKLSIDESEESSISPYDSRKVWFGGDYASHSNSNSKWRSLTKKENPWKQKPIENISNLAASLLIGKKVLARRDRDGYYYLGTVTDASSRNTFKVRFDNCLALQKSFLEQETCLENIISYTDGLRNDIYVGDKVLAPVGEDGRYGSGVLVEGVDLRKGQSEGQGSDVIVVSMFNGETKEVPCGLSVKISEELNSRIRSEIYLPESLRKTQNDNFSMSKTKDYESNGSLAYNFHDTKQSWMVESWPKPKSQKHKEEPLDHLRNKIEKQIEEGEMLLQQLYLEDREYARELGYASSEETETTYDDLDPRYDVRPKIDRESFRTWREKFLADTFRSTPKPTKNAWDTAAEPIDKELTKKQRSESKLKKGITEEGYHKHRLELLNHWEKHKHTPKYSPYIKYDIPSPPTKPKGTSTSSGKGPERRKKVVFNTATQNVRSEPRIRRRLVNQPRPASREYHAHDGVPFPPSTDRKFKQADPYRESWTVENATKLSNQPINIITNKPLEYYANGHGPTKGVEIGWRETRNETHEQRQRDLAKNRAKKERTIKEREEFHRVKKEQLEFARQERLRKYKEGQELNRQQRRAVRDDFIQFQKEKEERAQRYKQERLDAMKERRARKDIEDTTRERATLEAKEKLLNGQTTRDTERRKTFEASLDNEIKMQEKKLDRLRKVHASRLNKEDTRTSRAFQDRNLRDHVGDQTRQMYRASILP